MNMISPIDLFSCLIMIRSMHPHSNPYIIMKTSARVMIIAFVISLISAIGVWW